MTEAKADPTSVAFDDDAARRILHSATMRAELSRTGLTRSDLAAAAAAVGVSAEHVDVAINEELSRGRVIHTEADSPQLPTVAAAAVLGAVGSALVDVSGGGPMAGLLAVTAIVLAEAGLASRLKGKLKLATFNAANVVAWGAWTVASTLFSIDIPWDVSIAASIAGAAIGSALILIKDRKHEDETVEN